MDQHAEMQVIPPGHARTAGAAQNAAPGHLVPGFDSDEA